MRHFRILASVAVVVMTANVVSAQTRTQTSAPVTDRVLIASSADGSKLVAPAVGDQLPYGAIYESTDRRETWVVTTLATRSYELAG